MCMFFWEEEAIAFIKSLETSVIQKRLRSVGLFSYVFRYLKIFKVSECAKLLISPFTKSTEYANKVN